MKELILHNRIIKTELPAFVSIRKLNCIRKLNLRLLSKESGTHFDPVLTEVFLDIRNVFIRDCYPELLSGM